MLEAVSHSSAGLIRRPANAEDDSRNCLLRYAADIQSGLNYMSNNPTGYPEDMVVIEEDAEWSNRVTSPTNIGLFLASIVASRDMLLIGADESDSLVNKVLESLEKAETYEGLFYNWYSTQTNATIESVSGKFVSTVDNAWLATGLMTIKSAMPSCAEQAENILHRMNLPILYDEGRDLFYGGIDTTSKHPTTWHYDILNTEGRMASYVGISRYGIPPINYSNLGKYAPAGEDTGQTGFGQSLLAWGGSKFEADMPALFVDEDALSNTWAYTHSYHTAKQIEFGMRNDKGFWGYSPCYSPSNGYIESGLRELAVSRGGYGTQHVIATYAVFLSLETNFDHSIQNLQRIRTTYPDAYREGFGFTDSVDVVSDKVANAYLSLDQAMSLLAIANVVTGNSLREYLSPQLEAAKILIRNLDLEIGDLTLVA
ncbi:hypothetical protein BH10PAT3_BH10PAT3_0600 [soil metagenome]